MTHMPLARFRPTLLALALAAAFAPAHGDEKKDDSKGVESSVTVGAGAVTGSDADQALFGQYHGFAGRRDFGGLLAVDYSLRRPETGAWVDFRGSDLLGGQRELDAVWKRLGEWRVGASYGELRRREPHAVVDAAGAETRLQTKRTALGFSAQRTFTPALVADFDIKHELKEGLRLFGRGFTCPSPVAPGCAPATGIATGSAVLLIPEPIDATHTQLEARLSYAQDKLRFSLGYHGSFYRNELDALQTAVPGSLNNPVGTLLPISAGLQAILNQPMALPPDNQAHQVDFSGSYDFSPATRATFKLAWGRATQDDSFAAVGFTGPAGTSSLDAEVQTLLARVGFTSRLTKAVTLSGDLRFEDRDDKTPLALYNVEGTSTYTNRRLPYRKVKGKLQGAWQIDRDWRATAGAEYESIDRGAFTATSAVSGISALRQETEEVGAFAELRRRMSENVSGAVKVSTSRRDGSNWLRDNSGTGVTEVSDTSQLPATTILMPTLADRRRDKVKVFADWQPSDELALQLSAEHGRDRYEQLAAYGLASTSVTHLGVDATYAISEKWHISGFASWGRQAVNQARPFGYIMALRNDSLTTGINVTGKATAKLEVGGGLSFVDDRTEHRQTLDPLAGADSATLLAATGGLPDITFRQATLRLFGKYAIAPKSQLRVELAWQRTRWNDWAWQYAGMPFAYSDGTTVHFKPTQSVVYLGVTYRREF